ncbi:MAG: ABC transporter ATP-binding protein [Aigarchaeota archaeon]|nr:ABC transporter ATP-binding protein [Aigarchaeota archaeon]MCS7127158.1 ABC transporter ATP-binding protein [Candidatus Calditenuaceae archaeon]MDW8043281.1 ABC transporter ATP-binding protein [Nitrososphaerota archaeon]
MGKEVLRTEGLVKRFGEFVAVNKVSLSFEEGERTAIIGPNGAGKTTFINLVTGQLRADEGSVFLNGRDITGLSPHERVKEGLNRTFQIPSVFKSLTVEQNLLVATSTSGADADEVGEIIEGLGLRPYLTTKAALLPYGLMKVLELGIALLSRPSVLFLDEPTAGLNVGEKERIVSLLQSLPSRVTLVVVEHDMDVVFTLARRIVVMHRGEVLADGAPQAIAADQRVKEVYLG